MKPESKKPLTESEQLYKYKVAAELMAEKVDKFVNFIEFHHPDIDTTTAILTAANCLDTLPAILLSDPKLMHQLKESASKIMALN